MAANTRLQLTPFTLTSTRRQTKEAVRRLKGAHDSVDGLFGTLHAVRDAKVRKGVSITKLSHGEVDILRSALVFSGAGLDAVLKQLIHDALPKLLVTHTAARGAMAEYGGKLTKEEPAKAKTVLVSHDPTAKLRELYEADLTNGSLQGHTELIAVRQALGLSKVTGLSDTILNGFSDFFKARNEVVHELDLIAPTGRGTFTRRTRKMEETRERCDAAIAIAGEFVLATEKYL